jgi:hypothetical protein
MEVKEMRKSASAILILSYFYPPCNKVGGRRWAKFGKYLHNHGYEVFVVCVDFRTTQSCPWEQDVVDFRNNITRLPYRERRPFYRRNKAPKSIVGKIRYRLSLLQTKVFSAFSDNNLEDISRGYKRQLLKEAERKISNNAISTLIITGGPFEWCYDAIVLKERYPHLNCLLDLRDFWTRPVEDPTKAKQEEEYQKERKCVELANHVCTPAERIKEHLVKLYPTEESKIFVLPHAYDMSELADTGSEQRDSTVLSFVYAGILYSQMEHAIGSLCRLMNELLRNNIKVRVDLYTFDLSYSDVFIREGLGDVVKYHRPVSPKVLFRVLRSKDYLLQLRAGNTLEQHFKSTKFYELIALRKPIIYFGPEGDVSEFLTQHRLGFSGNVDPRGLCNKILSNQASQAIPDKDFDVSEFEFENVTKMLELYV